MANFSDPDPFPRTARDPFARPDPFTRRRSPKAEFRTPLDPEAETGALHDLVGYTSSALQTGLSALDKPARAVRGLLAGRVREIGNLVPFSDSLGITDERDRVSGRNLTDWSGLTEKRDQGWGAWAAGMGTEIITDPTTYLGFGALHATNPAGAALKAMKGGLRGWGREAMLQGFHALEPELLAAGHSAEAITGLRHAGQRIATQAQIDAVGRATGQALVPRTALSGLVQAGLPFGPKAAPWFSGPGAQRVARTLDRTGDYLRFGNPIGRAISANFDSRVGGAIGAMTQRAWAKHGTPALEAGRATSRAAYYGLISRLEPAFARAGVPEADVMAGVIRAGEGLKSGFPLNTPGGAAIQEAGRFGQGVHAAQMEGAASIGLPLNDAADAYTQYMPRQSIDVASANRQIKGSNLYPVVTGSNFHRDPLFRNIPGGSTRIDDWVQRFAGQVADPLTAHAIKKDMVLDLQKHGGAMTKALGQQFDTHAEALAEKLAGLSPKHVAAQIPLYTPDYARVLAKRGEQHARTMASAETVMGALADNARRMVPGDPGMVGIPQVLKSLGLKTRMADVAAGTPISGAMAEAARRLRRVGMPEPGALLYGPLKDLRANLNQYGLTAAHHAELIKAHQGWAHPETIKGPIRVIDDFTNAFKGLAYPTWLPSHVRNAFTAFVSNLTNRTRWSGYAGQHDLIRGTATAAQLGKLLPDMPAGLGDEAARVWARGKQFEDAKIFGAHNAATDLSGHVLEQLQSGGRFTPDLPGSGRAGTTGSTLGDAARLIQQGVTGQVGTTGGKLASIRPFGLFGGQAKGLDRLKPWRWTDPAKSWGLGMAGVAGGVEDTMPLLRAGRVGGTNIEDFFRGASYLSDRSKGIAGDVAGRTVNKLHFDYDALTGFEKNVMKRAVPFYTFARKNLPLQAEMLATRPGIATTQMRLMNAGRGPNDYIPDYLAAGSAVPLGTNPDGTKRYISGFGTSLEEALERFKFKGGLPDIRNTALSFAGAMNPLFKGPLEQLSNTQFHTGRKLSDLHAPAGVSAFTGMFGEDNPQLLSQMLINTPATRFLTSADKAIDERKPLWAKMANLLSGVKITDVNTERTRAAEAAGARDEILAGMPHIREHPSFYVRPENVAKLTPAEVHMMRILTTMQARAKAAAQAQDRARPDATRIGVRP